MAPVVTIAALCLCACDAYTGARGVVTDETGEAVRDARVQLIGVADQTPREVRTTDAGDYQVGLVHGTETKDTTLRVTKPGRKPAEAHLDPRRFYECNVTLEPDDSDRESSMNCTPKR